jgi:hypothetical protein
MKIKILICIFLLMLFGHVYAYEESTDSVITEITAQSNAHRFAISGGTLCGTSVFTIHTSSTSGREQFSLVLAAAASGRKVKLQIWAACPSTDPSQNWGMSTDYIAITAKF